ncbi:hypothetical protein HYV73_02880 [Candidatus Uhrbacteria bacterium]|nr:hypothetical protein [Candidatus Uhrbacteria bacterium]
MSDKKRRDRTPREGGFNVDHREDRVPPPNPRGQRRDTDDRRPRSSLEEAKKKAEIAAENVRREEGLEQIFSTMEGSMNKIRLPMLLRSVERQVLSNDLRELLTEDERLPGLKAWPKLAELGEVGMFEVRLAGRDEGDYGTLVLANRPDRDGLPRTDIRWCLLSALKNEKADIPMLLAAAENIFRPGLLETGTAKDVVDVLMRAKKTHRSALLLRRMAMMLFKKKLINEETRKVMVRRAETIEDEIRGETLGSTSAPSKRDESTDEDDTEADKAEEKAESTDDETKSAGAENEEAGKPALELITGGRVA